MWLISQREERITIDVHQDKRNGDWLMAAFERTEPPTTSKWKTEKK